MVELFLFLVRPSLQARLSELWLGLIPAVLVILAWILNPPHPTTPTWALLGQTEQLTHWKRVWDLQVCYKHWQCSGDIVFQSSFFSVGNTLESSTGNELVVRTGIAPRSCHLHNCLTKFQKILLNRPFQLVLMFCSVAWILSWLISFDCDSISSALEGKPAKDPLPTGLWRSSVSIDGTL